MALAERMAPAVRGLERHIPGPWRRYEAPTQAEKLESVLKSAIKSARWGKETVVLEANVEDPVYVTNHKGRETGILEEDAFDVMRKYGWQETNISWVEAMNTQYSPEGRTVETPFIHDNPKYPNTVFVARHLFVGDWDRARLSISVKPKTSYDRKLLANPLPFVHDLDLSKPLTALAR